jgi:4-diphosphocytidyl-2-C-methyl-D-erythritol kinase
MAASFLHNCPAPAKLNLFLHVTGRRADGYHLLQTAFQLIDWCDTLHFDLRSDGQIRRSTEVPGVPEQQDLIVRALRLLAAEIERRSGQAVCGVDVAIDKILPMGGGLGGGSSDAATALLAMNALWQGGLSRDELMALGLPLGADIPFFLYGQTAFAEGVGEALQAVSVPERWFVVLQPGVSIPTAAIFCAEDLTRDTKPVRITDFSRHLDSQSDVSGFGKNDLQAVATRLFPAVADAVAWLGQFGAARMTGSGSCVFGAFASESEADAVLAQVPAQWSGTKAKSLARHPLQGLL